MVEVKAALWALSLAVSYGWRCIFLEGDCKLISETLPGYRKRAFHIQTIVDNCLSFRQNFDSISFVFCFRECNQVARRLAQWARRGVSDEIWEHVAPDWLRDVLYSDFSSFES
ncbi:unnamed protein product [Amaranthus hypochondriacus]